MRKKEINRMSICAFVCGAMLISGCSNNPYNRAKEVKDELGKSAYVLSESHERKNSELITVQRMKEYGSQFLESRTG